MIKTLQQFIFEKEEKLLLNSFCKKINFITRGKGSRELAGFDSMYKELNDTCLDELYNAYHIESKKKYDKVDGSLPTIYYAGFSSPGPEFLKNNPIKKENQLNRPDEMKKSGNKSNFYKIMKDSNFICNTAYNVEDACNLKFPVIAKPDNSHSGKGIIVFQTKEDLLKNKSKFDNYAEAIDLDVEFRVIVLKNRPILISERVPKKGNAIEDKDKDKTVEFVYVNQDMDKLTWKKELGRIINEIKEKIDLDLWSVDLMLDKKGSCWVAEINSATGMAADKMAKIYMEIYDEYNEEKLPQQFKDYLKEKYIDPVDKENVRQNKKWILLSKNRGKEYAPYL